MIALQLQAGDGMEIAFKDIEIREIDPNAWQRETMLVSSTGDGTVVRSLKSRHVRYTNHDPQLAIEWSLQNGRTTILQPGKYAIADRIDIPRSDVTLIIEEGAEIRLLEGAKRMW